MKTPRKLCSIDQSRQSLSRGHPNREWLIRRARHRMASGFYDRPACLDVAIERMLDEARSAKDRAGEGPSRARDGAPENRAA